MVSRFSAASEASNSLWRLRRNVGGATSNWPKGQADQIVGRHPLLDVQKDFFSELLAACYPHVSSDGSRARGELAVSCRDWPRVVTGMRTCVVISASRQ